VPHVPPTSSSFTKANYCKNIAVCRHKIAFLSVSLKILTTSANAKLTVLISSISHVM
jgi:hypothetical protein